MTSIVDTSVKNFNSTMAGAPALSGTAGSLVALLDALLVNGFDLKTATGLTVAGGVATMPFTGSHSAQLDSVILIAGITGPYASLNGEQKVTAVGAGLVRFATNMADGTAAGTITFKMAPAGFEKPFSKTNVGVYRSLDPASTKMLFRVDDTGTTFARVVGYEAMTDVDTGTGAFPTAAQVSGGGYWAKSMVASAAAVPWVLHADARIFLFTPIPGVTSNAGYLGGVTRYFGDFIPLRPGGDAYACGLNYSGATAVTGQTEGGAFNDFSARTAMPRNYTGLGSSVIHGIYPYVGYGTSVTVAVAMASGIDGSLGAFPSPVDGSLQLSRKYAAVGSSPRAELPGGLHVPQSGVFDSFKQLDRVAGTGAFAGRTLQAVSTFGFNSSFTASSTNLNTGAAFIDITGPWR